ncbi:MAG: histidinol-phosphatase HisJ family protein [Thermoanaerobaculia bacterium]
MLTDYHTHTWRCGHAIGTMDDYVETAIRRGIAEIGLSDHLWLYFDPPERRDARWAMSEEEYEAHYTEMLATRERFAGRIEVRVSVEADYFEGREDDLLAILRRYDFDYVLGGIHFMGEWLIDDPDQRHRYDAESVAAIYRDYYRRLRSAVRSGAFDLLAHFDLPKKFGHVPESDIAEDVAETLDAVAESGIAVEISSAGLRAEKPGMYPAPSILREMRRRGIPIALSSDAHDPRDVGFGYDALVEAAHAAGYRSLVTFQRRERRMMPLG